MFTVIGLGSNSVEVPMLFFTTAERAEQFLLDLGLEKQEEYYLEGDYPSSRNPDGTDKDRAVWEAENEARKKIYLGTFRFIIPDPMPPKVREALFKSYYDGCGGIYSCFIEQVEEGKPIVGFDLD